MIDSGKIIKTIGLLERKMNALQEELTNLRDLLESDNANKEIARFSKKIQRKKYAAINGEKKVYFNTLAEMCAIYEMDYKTIRFDIDHEVPIHTADGDWFVKKLDSVGRVRCYS